MELFLVGVCLNGRRVPRAESRMMRGYCETAHGGISCAHTSKPERME